MRPSGIKVLVYEAFRYLVFVTLARDAYEESRY